MVYVYIQARHEIKLAAKIMVRLLRSYIKVTEQYSRFKSEVE